jgi:ATP-dependent Clp protease ATP-binding subunit ClpA
MRKHADPLVQIQKKREAWKHAYRNFLQEVTAKSIIPRYEHELQQALFGTKLYSDHDLEDVDLKEETGEPADEWMIMLRALQKYQNHEVPIKTWKCSVFDWNVEFVATLPTWIGQQNVSPAFKDRCKNFDIERFGSPEQKFAFRLICDHVKRSEAGEELKPLRMLLLGTAGTGKTTVIKAVRHALGDRLHAAATTGAASTIILACTIHSLLKLPITGKTAIH